MENFSEKFGKTENKELKKMIKSILVEIRKDEKNAELTKEQKKKQKEDEKNKVNLEKTKKKYKLDRDDFLLYFSSDIDEISKCQIEKPNGDFYDTDYFIYENQAVVKDFCKKITDYFNQEFELLPKKVIEEEEDKVVEEVVEKKVEFNI